MKPLDHPLVKQVMKDAQQRVRYPPERFNDNPYLTRSSVDELKRSGDMESALLAEAQLDAMDGDDIGMAMDPLEILIALEEYNASQGD